MHTKGISCRSILFWNLSTSTELSKSTNSMFGIVERKANFLDDKPNIVIMYSSETQITRSRKLDLVGKRG